MFRHRKIKPRVVVPVEPTVLKRVVSVKDDGTQYVTFVRTTEQPSLPKYTDYKLQNLLESGVPLKQLNPVYGVNEDSVMQTAMKLQDEFNKSDSNKTE